MGVVCAEFYPYQGQRFHPSVDSWSGNLTLAVGPNFGVFMNFFEFWKEFKCPRVVLLPNRNFGNAWNSDVCVAEIFMMVIKQSSQAENPSFLHKTELTVRTTKGDNCNNIPVLNHFGQYRPRSFLLTVVYDLWEVILMRRDGPTLSHSGLNFSVLLPEN